MAAALDMSIVVPSYDRGEVVAQNMDRWLALDPPAREIILVDDASNEPSAGILRELGARHPAVRCIRLDRNGGQAVARSAGLAAATGKYIVSLDDDSWLLDDDALARISRRMEATPRCAILAFNLFSPGLEIAPARDALLAVSDHLTCGAAYRNETLRRIGYHLGFLRYVGEESDLSIKARGADCEVLKDLNVRGFHDYDPSRRSPESLRQVRMYGVRNDLARTVVFFPWVLVPGLLAWHVFAHLRFGMRHRLLGPTLRGYAAFAAVLPETLRSRSPIPLGAARRYLELRRAPEAVGP
jgi:glycosyltransferase involved in cell wall biosynthesis